jgi:hypothetical protein
MTLETDYLIIGAGVSGLAFADELLTCSDATMTLVDKRPAPGGHWNDAYSFVKLHQPSILYGVESTPMGRDRLDTSGPNAGFLELAEGPEILNYLHSLTRDRLLQSGRVTFLPNSEVLEDGRIRHLLSGAMTEVQVRRKTVDASWYTNAVPRTSKLPFTHASDVSVIPPNELPLLVSRFNRFAVIGSGKTGIDVVVWLLENGVPPARVRWILGRDAWFLNRAFTQPGDAFFETTFQSFIEQRRALAEATDARDYALRMEACGAWIRLDPDIHPEVYHAATVSEGELDYLRQVDDTVRLGHVTHIDPDRVVLERGDIPADPDTLYIACTATALPPKPIKPVFEGDRITLQMVRSPQIPFSAALIAFLEAELDTDEEKNALTMPLPLPDTVADFIKSLWPDMLNRYACSKHPKVRAWVNQSRLDGFSKIAAAVAPDDDKRRALIADVKTASVAAAENMGRLMEALDEGRTSGVEAR